MNELILSGDTINEGRIKINNAYSNDTHIWISGDTLTSIVANNSSGNAVESDHSSVLGGQNNKILNSTGAAISSVIAGGSNNLITGNSVSNSSAVVGGQSNTVISESSVVLGGLNNFVVGSDIPDLDNTLFVPSLETNNSRVKNVTLTEIGNAVASSTNRNINADYDLIDLYSNFSVNFSSSTLTQLGIANFISSRSGRTVDVIWTRNNTHAATASLTVGGGGQDFYWNGEYSGAFIKGVIVPQLAIDYSDYPGGFRLVHGGRDSSGAVLLWAYGVNVF